MNRCSDLHTIPIDKLASSFDNEMLNPDQMIIRDLKCLHSPS
jgi:hypothetical protein